MRCGDGREKENSPSQSGGRKNPEKNSTGRKSKRPTPKRKGPPKRLGVRRAHPGSDAGLRKKAFIKKKRITKKMHRLTANQNGDTNDGGGIALEDTEGKKKRGGRLGVKIRKESHRRSHRAVDNGERPGGSRAGAGL